MYHNDHNTSTTTKPAKQSINNATRSYATAGNAQADTTVLTSDFVNTVSDELLNVLDAATVVPDKTKDDQLLLAIQTLVSNGSKDTITNGSCAIDQRRDGNPYLVTATAYHWIVDRILNLRAAPNTTEIRQQLWTGGGGFDNCAQIRAVTAYPAVAGATDYDTGFMYILEKSDLEGFYNKNITLSFRFKATVVGKYSAGFFLKDEFNQVYSYIHQFEILVSDVDQHISVTLPSFERTDYVNLNSSDRSLHIVIGGLAGVATDKAVTDAELDSVIFSTSGRWYAAAESNVNWQETVDATIQMTGLQIDKGAHSSPFRFASYADELQQCQRYYERLGNVILAGYEPEPNGSLIHLLYKVTKRTNAVVVKGTVTNHKTSVSGQVAIPLTNLGAGDLTMVQSFDKNGVTIRTAKAVADQYSFTIANLSISSDLAYSNF